LKLVKTHSTANIKIAGNLKMQAFKKNLGVLKKKNWGLSGSMIPKQGV